jgi:hypothetical protein
VDFDTPRCGLPRAQNRQESRAQAAFSSASRDVGLLS